MTAQVALDTALLEDDLVAGGPDRVTAGETARRWVDPRRWPGWAQALLVLAASRVLVTFVAYRAARMAAPHPDGRPWGYLEIANNWDGTWYERVATLGYPDRLPVDATGAVVSNPWAFYPLFPRLTGTVAQVADLRWVTAATIVSLVAAAGAVVLMRGVIARVAGPRAALWTVALFCFFPSAAVLQLPYAESLAILVLTGVFAALQRRRYVLAIPLLLLLGVARPVAVPMAVVVFVHLIARFRENRSPRSLIGPVLATGAAGLAALEWPLIAWAGTGVPDAYTTTMAAWRTPRQVVPFRPWWSASQYYLGEWVGPVALIVVLGALVWWLARPQARVIGTDLRVWVAAYSFYLLAVLDSFTSLPRYLLPLFPLGTLILAVSRSRAYRIALTGAFASMIVVWMLAIWRSSIWAP